MEKEIENLYLLHATKTKKKRVETKSLIKLINQLMFI